MDSKIAKKNQSLTKAEEMRNQTKLLMKPHANWEEYLIPAPLSIAILGELVIISCKTDFSINKNPPKDGYKHIRYPDSFRACLMQVCNSSWGAFNEAHNNMDQIRLHTMAIPDYTETAMKILYQGNDEVVEAHLHDQLENIRLIEDECLELTRSTEQRFTDVINIIQELLEACVNAECFYGEELNDIKKKLDEAKLRKQSSVEAGQRSEKAMKAMEQQLKEAHESYNKAMDSLPSGWDMICMDVVAGLTESITILVNGVTSIITHPGNQLCNASTAISNTIQSVKCQESAVDGVDIAPTPPMMFKEEKKSEKLSASQRASENARFRIEQSRAQLEKTRDLYEKRVENTEKNQKELTDLPTDIINGKVKNIHFITIQKLVKGMHAMGRVKEQWGKMVRIFQMVSNIVKTSLTRTLKGFVTMSQKTQALSYNAKLFSKDLLYNQAIQATTIASLINMISATYTEVSNNHIMDRISSLGKLMAMDKEKPEFLYECERLQNSCDEAQKAILHFIIKNKEKFEKKMILPAAAPEEIKSIQEAVKSGFTDGE